MNVHCYAIFVSYYRLMSQVNLTFPTSGGDTEVGFVMNEAVFENFHKIYNAFSLVNIIIIIIIWEVANL